MSKCRGLLKKGATVLKTVITSDIYEAAYYSMRGCNLKTIEGVPANGKITCKLTFEGENVEDLQIEYFHGRAMVNLMEFRRMYSQVCNWMSVAKRKLKNELRNGGTV